MNNHNNNNNEKTKTKKNKIEGMPLVVYRASECSSKNAVGSVVVVVVVFV